MEIDLESFKVIMKLLRIYVVCKAFNSKLLQKEYVPIHGYLSLCVCLVGVIFNFFNILVLTQKNMRSNPINLILTGIAVADGLNMIEYIPFTFHMYIFSPGVVAKEDWVSHEPHTIS